MNVQPVKNAKDTDAIIVNRIENAKASELLDSDGVMQLENLKEKRGKPPFFKIYSSNDIYTKKHQENDSSKPVDPKFRENPKAIYLFCLFFNDDGEMDIRQFYYSQVKEIEYGQEVEELIDNMTASILDVFDGKSERLMHGLKNTRQINFENIIFWEKCFVAFVVIEKNWRLHLKESGRAAIQFVIWDEAETDEQPYDDNYCFFDAKNFNVDTSGQGIGDYVPGVYMINHYLDENLHEPSVKNPQNFRFDIFLTVKFAVNGLGDIEKTIVIDPTGKNGGPPAGGSG